MDRFTYRIYVVLILDLIFNNILVGWGLMMLIGVVAITNKSAENSTTTGHNLIGLWITVCLYLFLVISQLVATSGLILAIVKENVRVVSRMSNVWFVVVTVQIIFLFLHYFIWDTLLYELIYYGFIIGFRLVTIFCVIMLKVRNQNRTEIVKDHEETVPAIELRK